MMRRLGLLVPAGVLLLLGSPASGELIHVPGDEPTIQAGIDAGSPGDTVIVACGTYSEHDIVMVPGVSVCGATSDAACVVIDAGQQGRVLYGDGLTFATCLRDMTLANGIAVGADEDGRGGGFFCVSGNPVIRNVAFADNQAITGGGMWCAGSSPQIEGCTFSGNVSSYGGGIRLAGNSAPVLSHCLFTDNVAMVSGGGFYTSSSNPHIVNATFCRNSAWEGGSAIHSSNRETVVDNSVIAFCPGPSSVACDIGGSASLSCCNVFGNGGDWIGCIENQDVSPGNMSEDPVFCEMSTDDFGIDESSPCAPGNNVCAALIGAIDVSCDQTSVEGMSWGRIKDLYR